jgi:hypothetical protein
MVKDPDPVPALLRDPDDDYLVALASGRFRRLGTMML